MKRVERRGTLEHHQHVQQQASNLSMPTVASPLPIRRSSSHTRNVPVTHSQSSDRSVQRSDTVIVTTTSTTASGSGRVGPGSTHIISSPQPSYIQLGRSSPATKVPRAAPPSPPSITTLNDGEADVADREDSARPIGPGSRVDSRSSSMDDRRVAGAAPRPGTAPPAQEEANGTTGSPPTIVPSKRSPLSSEQSPSIGSKSKHGSPQTTGGDVDADVDVDAEAEPDVIADVSMGAEVDVDADAEADADAELMEAVDAAEANSSGGRLKEEL
jgi:hypothetical protein